MREVLEVFGHTIRHLWRKLFAEPAERFGWGWTICFWLEASLLGYMLSVIAAPLILLLCVHGLRTGIQNQIAGRPLSKELPYRRRRRH